MRPSIARVWNDFFFTGFGVESLGLLRFWFCTDLMLLHSTQFYGFYEIAPTA